MNITIKQMQAFVAVARCRSFAEACELVHLSQPALSITIRKLEDEVGGRLFARSTRSVSLTPEGEAFYPVVKRLLADWEQALEDVHNLFALRRGKLELAAMPTFTSSLLPGVLGAFHRRYPAVNVSVQDVVAEQVVELVRSGRAELGVTFDPGDASDLEFLPLFTDRLVAVLPTGHPLLALARPLRWSDLKAHSYIALQRPSSLRLLIDRMLRDKGVVLSPAFEAHQLVSVGRMVCAGLGVSAVPTMSAPQMEEMGAEVRPLASPAVTRKVGIITRRRYPLSVAASAMHDILSTARPQSAAGAHSG